MAEGNTIGFIRDLTGSTAAKAAERAGALQAGTARDVAERFEPFRQLGLGGIEQAGFLTDPQAQFEFLQQNPLFQAALEQAQTGTQNIAAARGRLSAGDTLQQLSQNVLLSAAPLIQGQKQSITDLLNIGTGATAAGGELLTGATAAEAGGIVGAAQARGAGAQNILTTGLLAGALMFPPAAAAAAPAASDKRLKENIKKIGFEKGHNIYSWTWNKLAKTLGLTGDSFGVLAQEVMDIMPEAVVSDGAFLKVNYDMIGIKHGN